MTDRDEALENLEIDLRGEVLALKLILVHILRNVPEAKKALSFALPQAANGLEDCLALQERYGPNEVDRHVRTAALDFLQGISDVIDPQPASDIKEILDLMRLNLAAEK